VSNLHKSINNSAVQGSRKRGNKENRGKKRIKDFTEERMGGWKSGAATEWGDQEGRGGEGGWDLSPDTSLNSTPLANFQITL
jgi:hypothetical protein